MVKKFKTVHKEKPKITIAVSKEEMDTIRARAKKGFGGNVSLYLRTLACK